MSIGMIDTTNRRVRPNSELDRLVNFGTLENTNPILHPDGTVAQTVTYMKQIVRDHHKDVAKIADKLYDPKLSRFLRNVFDFVMAYVKYETDSAFTEQLRTPLRTLKDQKRRPTVDAFGRRQLRTGGVARTPKSFFSLFSNHFPCRIKYLFIHLQQNFSREKEQICKDVV